MSTLRHYYVRYGVKFKRPDYRYWKSQAENRELQSQQLEFVQKLGTMIKEDAYTEIVYIDETTFHLWQKVPKCWLRPGMKLSLSKSRGPSITVIGAISELRGLVHYDVFDGSNNGERFKAFLSKLKQKCFGKTVVVLDNLKVHHAKILDQVYDSNFKEMLLPPYSCELNPIERLWSVVKRKWVKNLYSFTEELYLNKQTKAPEMTKLTVEKLKELLCKI